LKNSGRKIRITEKTIQTHDKLSEWLWFKSFWSRRGKKPPINPPILPAMAMPINMDVSGSHL
jgi:hypothetical protein